MRNSPDARRGACEEILEVVRGAPGSSVRPWPEGYGVSGRRASQLWERPMAQLYLEAAPMPDLSFVSSVENRTRTVPYFLPAP